jgi:hypothetical protein
MSEPYYGWAVDAVDGLRWLADIDEWAFADPRERLRGRDSRVVDVTHVRWATTTAVTAIDLCVAEVAVRYCDEPFWSKHMPGLADVRKLLSGRSGHGPTAALGWLNSVQSDDDYRLLRRGARDRLTHHFLVRSALIGPGRTPFELDRAVPAEDRPDAREVILLSLKVAAHHVDEFGRTVGRSSAAPPPRPA